MRWILSIDSAQSIVKRSFPRELTVEAISDSQLISKRIIKRTVLHISLEIYWSVRFSENIVHVGFPVLVVISYDIAREQSLAETSASLISLLIVIHSFSAGRAERANKLRRVGYREELQFIFSPALNVVTF